MVKRITIIKMRVNKGSSDSSGSGKVKSVTSVTNCMSKKVMPPNSVKSLMIFYFQVNLCNCLSSAITYNKLLRNYNKSTLVPVQ